MNASHGINGCAPITKVKDQTIMNISKFPEFHLEEMPLHIQFPLALLYSKHSIVTVKSNDFFPVGLLNRQRKDIRKRMCCLGVTYLANNC